MNRTIPFYQQAEHQYYVCALCPCCHIARTWYAIYYFCSLRTYCKYLLFCLRHYDMCVRSAPAVILL